MMFDVIPDFCSHMKKERVTILRRARVAVV